MKIFLLCLILVSSCAHKKVREESLDLWNSFAFEHEGTDYFFGRKTVKEGKKKCTYFVGYKNEELLYTFPTTKLPTLNQMYSSKDTLYHKMSNAVATFEKWSREEGLKDCESSRNQLDDVLTFVVYSPLIVIAAPLWLPEVIGGAVDVIPGRMDQLRLGMTFAEVEKLLLSESFTTEKGAFLVRKDETGTFHVFDHKKYRLVMIFQDGKLKAWVRGLNPDLWKKNP